MMKLINRKLTKEIRESLRHFPVVALIGPRQCGKSTLVRYLLGEDKELVYLDLERMSDLQKLDEAEWFFQSQKEKIICLDEIQRKPEIFKLIRSLVDEWQRNSCFIVLGSASRDLLRQSSESLAGRISYKHLTPFLWSEIKELNNLEHYLIRGGFPGSYLAETNSVSMEWKENFISTFIESDLMQWSGSSPATVRRLWQMLAHLNGQTLNYSSLGNSLGVSNTTVKNQVDLLQSTFMVETIQPHITNTGKRLIKSPKIYISDPGILTALLGVKDFIQLSGHPVLGSLWEGTVMANLKARYPGTDIRFYRTNHGSEIDFLMILSKGLIAIECKASKAPQLSKGTFTAIQDLKPHFTFIVSPVEKGYPARKGIDVVTLDELTERIDQMI
jgi:predicted AAA+ superfamily ATPase